MQEILVYILFVGSLAYFGFRFFSTFFKKEKKCGNGNCGCN
jgi:hypothetical protein